MAVRKTKNLSKSILAASGGKTLKKTAQCGTSAGIHDNLTATPKDAELTIESVEGDCPFVTIVVAGTILGTFRRENTPTGPIK